MKMIYRTRTEHIPLCPILQIEGTVLVRNSAIENGIFRIEV